jgi:hypothetical protein
MHARAFRRALAGLMVFGVLGCSLGDYTERIDLQQKRLKAFDDENRLLASQPVGTPGQDQPAWPFEVYLRLPKGFSSSIAAVYKSETTGQVPLFRYEGGEHLQAFVALGRIDESTAKESKDADKPGDKKEKGKDGKGKDKKERAWEPEWTVEAFRTGVLNALLVVYHREKYQSTIRFPELRKVTKEPINDRGEPLPAISFEGERLKTETSLFAIYFHERGTRQAAVIIQYPHARDNEEFREAIDWCLKSLDIGGGASAKRQALKNRAGKK